jgi:hypothetical protein
MGTFRSGLESWNCQRGILVHDVERPGFYLDNGDADSPGSGKVNFPVVSEAAAG